MDSPLTRHLYHWDESLWMGLTGDDAHRVYDWIDSDIYTQLEQAQLIPKFSAEWNSLPGYDLGLRFESHFLPLRQSELSMEMLKHFARSLLKISIELDKNECCLTLLEPGQFGVDQHGRPQFIGIPAIYKKENLKFPFSDFASCFLCPLELVAKQPQLAGLARRASNLELGEYRSLVTPILYKFYQLAHLNQFIDLSPFGGLYHTGQYIELVQAALKEKIHRRRTGAPAPAPWTIDLLEKIQERIDGLNLSGINEKWSNYHNDHNIQSLCEDELNWRDHCEGQHPKQIITVLESEKRGTLLDLGANQGFFSAIGAQLGYEVTALDTDSGAIDQLYLSLLKSNFFLPIRPAVVNFVELNDEETSRFSSDVVLALGFTHHMRLVQGLSWDDIATTLAGLTKNLLVTEFKMETKARNKRGKISKHVEADYKIEKFLDSLKLHFSDVRLGDLTKKDVSGGGRQLILCSGKK